MEEASPLSHVEERTRPPKGGLRVPDVRVPEGSGNARCILWVRYRNHTAAERGLSTTGAAECAVADQQAEHDKVGSALAPTLVGLAAGPVLVGPSCRAPSRKENTTRFVEGLVSWSCGGGASSARCSGRRHAFQCSKN